MQLKIQRGKEYLRFPLLFSLHFTPLLQSQILRSTDTIDCHRFSCDSSLVTPSRRDWGVEGGTYLKSLHLREIYTNWVSQHCFPEVREKNSLKFLCLKTVRRNSAQFLRWKAKEKNKKIILDV